MMATSAPTNLLAPAAALSSALPAGPLEAQAPGDAFAQLLRDKAGPALPGARDGRSAAQRTEETQDADDPAAGFPEPPTVAPPPTPALPCDAAGAWRAMPLPPHAAPATGSPAPAMVDTAPAAPIAAALRMSPGSAAPPSILCSEPAAAWEVSLRDPRGVVITLRAERPEGPRDPGHAAPWTLTIAAPALDAAALLRHAPRLNERLKARALTPAHLRIDAGDERGG
jgi:hypothetical protein